MLKKILTVSLLLIMTLGASSCSHMNEPTQRAFSGAAIGAAGGAAITALAGGPVAAGALIGAAGGAVIGAVTSSRDVSLDHHR